MSRLVGRDGAAGMQQDSTQGRGGWRPYIYIYIYIYMVPITAGHLLILINV